ncbi:putative yippee zinc-binding/DNA-binding /Mis18, centromere assembly [Lyophyllum shimeji]|uniref:Yippee zinc-binding/DNA-binding /Mis18, centromere assembly n=1 Tax=Lyophyllum shimeji TaxID=47721 RepID=A0A9P3PLC9_LYOSH|nr:putative yippee zinc-binding/DNA-binding /Mis18, centromere assembly [Lyophyllum shimeji]
MILPVQRPVISRHVDIKQNLQFVSSRRSRRRPTSRPLPLVPRPLACKQCRTCITSSHVLLPPSAYPDSRLFKGFSGKASLFMETYNVKLSRPAVQLMATGAHTMQEITCLLCSSYLGWKIVRAHESSEKWKEGHCLLELENLYYNADDFAASVCPSHRLSSDSESDNSF